MDLPRILVTEDEEHTRKQIVDHFTKRINCSMLEAKDAYEAEKHIKEGSIDLILTDIKMPGKSGVEVIIQVREISKDLPIIVLSRLDDPQVEEKLKSLNVEIIPKPFPTKIVFEKSIEKLKACNKYFPKEI